MKLRIIVIVKWILAGLALFCLKLMVLLVIFVLFLRSDLNKPYDEDNFNWLVSEIKAADDLPDEFAEQYFEVYGERNTIETLTKSLYETLINECYHFYTTPSIEVAGSSRFLTFNTNDLTGNSYVLAMKLEKEVSQKECLNYMFARHDFLNMCIGVEEAADFYFNKSVEELNTEEIQTLILMYVNPSYYDPMKYPENIEKARKELFN